MSSIWKVIPARKGPYSWSDYSKCVLAIDATDAIKKFNKYQNPRFLDVIIKVEYIGEFVDQPEVELYENHIIKDSERGYVDYLEPVSTLHQWVLEEIRVCTEALNDNQTPIGKSESLTRIHSAQTVLDIIKGKIK